MHDADERPSRAVAAGALAALSVYFYTSNRLLPVALAAACLVRWSCARERRPNPEGARRLRAISKLSLLGEGPTPACVGAP